MDIFLSLIALIVLCPVLLAMALLVRVKIGRSVIFKQMRPGLNERIFVMYKCRAMTEERGSTGNLLPDNKRLIQLGKFLQITSLDEWSELFNIVKGDMSLVGPRSQLVKDIVFMDEQQRKRSTVLPGLTGWAQVNGRNSVTWEEKLKLDLDYLDSITFKNDIKILFMTVSKVLERKGSTQKERLRQKITVIIC